MMTKEEYKERLFEEISYGEGCGYGLIKFGVFVILFVILISSCATKTRIEYRDHYIDHYITNTVHDTLTVHEKDSVYHIIKTINDTVYDTKYVERTRYRDRIVERHDTCWRDSIITEYKETVRKVVKYPKTYWYAIGVSLLFFILVFIKLYRWLKMF